MNDDWKGVAGAVAVVVGMGEGEMAVVGWMAVLGGDGGAGVGWGVFLGKTVAVAEGIGSSGRVCGLAQAARLHIDSTQRTKRRMACWRWLSSIIVNHSVTTFVPGPL